MNLQPTLQNESVLLRPLVEDDREALFKVAKDPKIWEQHPCKRHLRVEFDTFFEESIVSKAALTIIDQHTKKIIGSSRYKIITDFPNGVEIGWTFLARNYWGGMYNKQVKDLMMNHAFTFVDHIILYVDKHNIRSQKAIRKIGGVLIDGIGFPELYNATRDDLTFVVRKELPL